MLYGEVKEAPNVSVEYQAADQIPSFYVALESLQSSSRRIAAVYKRQLTFNKRLLLFLAFDLFTDDKGLEKGFHSSPNSRKSLEE